MRVCVLLSASARHTFGHETVDENPERSRNSARDARRKAHQPAERREIEVIAEHNDWHIAIGYRDHDQRERQQRLRTVSDDEAAR